MLDIDSALADEGICVEVFPHVKVYLQHPEPEFADVEAMPCFMALVCLPEEGDTTGYSIRKLLAEDHIRNMMGSDKIKAQIFERLCRIYDRFVVPYRDCWGVAATVLQNEQESVSTLS